MSRYVGNEGITLDLNKVVATFETEGCLKVLLENGTSVGFNMTTKQIEDVIKFHKEHLLSLEKHDWDRN